MFVEQNWNAQWDLYQEMLTLISVMLVVSTYLIA